MHMQGNYDGTNAISDAAVLSSPSYMVTPTDMNMEMHMFGLMYAPTDRVTLMAMMSYVEMSMNHLTMSGMNFRTQSSGVGDSSISALINLWEDETSSMHAGLGLLLPTAKTDARDFIPPMGAVGRLPYPMQLGAGSWGIKPSITWNSHQEGWSYGAQASLKVQLNDNDEDYRLGNRFNFTTWIAKSVGEHVSFSLRANFVDLGNIHGRDLLIMGPVPTADPNLRGGSQLELSFGVNFFETQSGLRAAFELGKTIWRDLEGPQLSNDYSFTAGLQYAW